MIKLFVSYSQKDEEWKERVMSHLNPMLTGVPRKITVSKIEPSARNPQRLVESFAESDIIILLISADFLASEFIMSQESFRLISLHQQGLVILPVIIKPCAWQMIEWIAKFQVLPRDGQPLSSHKDLDQAIYDVAMRIVEIVEVIPIQKELEDRFRAEEKVPKAMPSSPTRSATQKTDRQVFICHDGSDGDFAELLKLKLEKAGYEAWIDVDRLRVGDDWRAEIDDAIRSSTALVAIMTPEAKESEYVTYEWAYAAGAGVKVIPLMLKLTQMHPRLESLQYIDFTNRRARPWERFIDELNKHSIGVGKG